MARKESTNVRSITSARRSPSGEPTVREQLVEILSTHPEGMKSADIKEALGRPPNELSNMRRDNLVERREDLWFLTEPQERNA
jgi:hypothetical protein